MPTTRITANGGPYTPLTEPDGNVALGKIPVLLTPGQLATLLGVSERKLEHDRHRGTGIPFVKYGRRVVYRGLDVHAYLAANVFSSTAEAKRSVR